MEVSNHHHSDNEHSRVANLESYLIMDSEPDISFDQLAFLASTICETPIALISFIDHERQWFKSSVGIELHELPRYLSACNQTIRDNDFYQISDSQTDCSEYCEFMNLEGFRFYAGVPISSQEGYALGTLCVLDYEPRTLNDNQIQTLKVIANQIIDLLEVRKKYRQNLKRLQQIDEANHRNEKYFHDVTHQARTRAVAELAAGVSFRVRPHIMAIQSAEKRLERTLELKPETQNELKILKDTSDEVLAILDSLDKFIQAEQEKSMKVLDMSEALEAVIRHLEYKFKKYDIDLVTDIESELRCIGNALQLKEIFFSVINNAIEAVVGIKERRVEVSAKKHHHKITIMVKDSGRGIPESIRPFIFQPFFTTKGPQGLGIGLSLAQTLLERHGGEIKLKNAYNPTTFCLTIPSP